VLELAIARELYAAHPEFDEGRLAKVRSHVVSRASCAHVAQQLDLGGRLSESGAAVSPEDLGRLARNRRILAALLEAALAALFLEHGFDAIEDAVVGAFQGRIEYAITSHIDHKTELQEHLARAGRQVSYGILEVEGPPHQRSFTAAATIDGEEVGVGRGHSKKDAEQAAAKEVLARLSVDGTDEATREGPPSTSRA